MSIHRKTYQVARHKQQEIELHHRLVDNYARRYAPPFAKLFQKHWNDEIMAALGSTEGRVLDCGCGTGILLPALERRFQHVYGIDLSLDMLRVAVARRRHDKSGYTVAVSDAAQLPYPDAFFDCLVCRSSLHHMPDLKGALCELNRVLKPGGRLVISEPCNDAWLVRMARHWLYAHSDKFQESDEAYSSAHLRQRVRAAGFRVVGWRRFGYLAYTLAGFPDLIPVLNYMPIAVPLTRALIQVDKVLVRTPILRRLGLHCMVTAEKHGNHQEA